MEGGNIVIKLGGSVITDKTVPYKIEENNIRHIVLDLERYGKKNYILIHGGGSIGHYLVNVLGLNLPNKSVNLAHVAKITNEMDKLTNIIIEEFLEKDIPVISMPTHTFLTTDTNGFKSVDFSSIKTAFSLGYVPLLRGDVVFDSERGFSIISGDDLVLLLATEFNASQVIMLTDVDGVIGSDSVVIKKLNLSENYQNMIWHNKDRHDVTGGILKKLDVMKILVKKGIKVCILSPRIQGRLLNALLGKPFVGTEVVI